MSALRVAMVQEGLRGGETQADIARRLGVSRQRVFQIVTAHDLEEPHLRLRREAAKDKRRVLERERLKRMALRAVAVECRNRNWPLKVIAAQLGYGNWKTIQNLIRRWR